MFENKTSLTISGGCFEEGTELKNILQYPFNIVYGPNGTGKSTISRAIADCSDNAVKTEDNAAKITAPEFSEQESKRIFVFNEDFVDKNVKIGQDGGLEAIVMLGKDVQLDDERREKETELKSYEAQSLKAYEELNGVADDDSKKGYYAKLENKKKHIVTVSFYISGDCVERRRDIRGKANRQEIPYKDVFAMKGNTKYSSNPNVLLQEIKDAIPYLASLRGSSKIDYHQPVFSLPFDIEEIDRLLTAKIRKPQLDTDDKFIIEILEKHIDLVQRTRDMLPLVEKYHKCPMCHQSLDGNAQSDLQTFVEDVLNDMYEKHLGALKSQLPLLTSLQFVHPQLPGKFGKSVDAVEKALRAVNAEIAGIADSIRTKISNVYQPLAPIDVVQFQGKMDTLNNAVDILNQEIDLHNKEAQRVNDIEAEALEKNLRLAYLVHKTEFDSCEDLEMKIADAEKTLAEANEKIKQLTAEIDEIDLKMQQTGTAMKYINDCIKYIFFNSSRLSLDLDKSGSGKYKLMTRNTPVPANRVSIGERNILALSYFFASIFQGLEDDRKYAADNLIVIDDPISSFDKGSRAGVLALLSRELDHILFRSRSKILILSHDRQTVNDLSSIRARILKNKYYKKGANKKNDESKTYEILQLLQPGLNSKRFAKLENYDSDYSRMVKNIFEYAKAPGEELGDPRFIGVGNQIRQVMETFCKISFNTEYAFALSCKPMWDSFYIGGLDGDECKNRLVGFLQEKLVREVFNSESHSNSTVDFGSFDNEYSPEELHEIAEALLIYIYGMAKNHLFGFIKNGVDDVWEMARKFVEEPPKYASMCISECQNLLSEDMD